MPKRVVCWGDVANSLAEGRDGISVVLHRAGRTQKPPKRHLTRNSEFSVTRGPMVFKSEGSPNWLSHYRSATSSSCDRFGVVWAEMI